MLMQSQYTSQTEDFRLENCTRQLELIIEKVKSLIRNSHVVLPNEGEVKFYHHKGFDNFLAVGAVFVSVIQHDYCKFIVAMLAGQMYPLHFHRIKDESYFILSGDLIVTLEDETHTLTKGDILNVPRRFTHSFRTQNGCVFEEISTAYLNNDSVYEDKEIGQSPGSFKTTVLPMSVLLDSKEKRGENSDRN